MKYYLLLPALVVLPTIMFPAQAHHAATATFDTSQTMEIEGFVQDFRFNNPHVSIVLAVMDENGIESEWVASAPAVAGFRRWGWTENTIEEGQYVRLVGRKARHDGPMILMERGDIEGGKLLEINPDDGTLIRILEGPKPNQKPNLGIPGQQLSSGKPNLSGTWLATGPGGSGSTVRNNPEFTASGQALQDAWDETKDPAYLTCEARGLQRLVGTIQSVRITQREDYVVIEAEDNDTPRLIYLDGRGPANTEHTLRGHSAAHYEGDTLVVETTQLLIGASSGGGNILSDQTTITERYSRADDEQYAALAVDITYTDPVNLAAPLKGGWRKLQTGDYEFAVTECHLPVLVSAD